MIFCVCDASSLFITKPSGRATAGGSYTPARFPAFAWISARDTYRCHGQPVCQTALAGAPRFLSLPDYLPQHCIKSLKFFPVKAGLSLFHIKLTRLHSCTAAYPHTDRVPLLNSCSSPFKKGLTPVSYRNQSLLTAQ